MENKITIHNNCCIHHGCQEKDASCPILTRKQKSSGICHQCDLDEEKTVTMKQLHEYLLENLSISIGQTYGGSYSNSKHLDVSLKLTDPRTGETVTISQDCFSVPD